MKNYYHESEIPEKIFKYFEEIMPPVMPCVILDPFSGSGTTGVVSKKLGRKCILIDLKEQYCDMSIERLRQGMLEL